MQEKILDEKKMIKVLLTGGGTGGHVFPALTVAEEILALAEKKKTEIDFLYIGTLFGMEKKIVKEKGIAYRGILSGKLRRYLDWRNITDGFLISAGFFQALTILKKYQPNIVFAKGGFVTVPVVLAARILKIPVIAHESDSVMGLANRLILPFVKKMALGFPPDIYKKIPVAKTIFTGNPVRDDILQSDLKKDELFERYHFYRNRKIILVLGGSQGSSAINDMVDNVLDELLEKYIVVHATGNLGYQYFREKREGLSERLKANYLIFDYIGKELGRFLVHSDLLISRAGANTLAEIVTLEKIAIVIPLPSAASDHQRKNAMFFQKQGLAVVMDEGAFSREDFLTEIERLLHDKNAREEMKQKMDNIFPRDSARQIAKEIFVIISQQKKEKVELEAGE